MKRNTRTFFISVLTLAVGLILGSLLNFKKDFQFTLPTSKTVADKNNYDCVLHGYQVVQGADRLSSNFSIEDSSNNRVLSFEVENENLSFRSNDFFNDPSIFSGKWIIDQNDDKRLTARFFEMIHGDNTRMDVQEVAHSAGIFMFEKGNGRAILTRAESDLGEDVSAENNSHLARNLYFVCE